MKTEDSLAVKKRIMFIKGEDFNFLAYNILILLDALGCDSEERLFIDHRKFSFLIDLVSSSSIALMLERVARLNSKLNKRDLHLLSTAYANGSSRKHFVTRIISALESKKIIFVKQAKGELALNVWLNANSLSQSFVQNEVYQLERNNIKLLANVSSKLRILKLDTFLARYFSDQGVHVWHS